VSSFARDTLVALNRAESWSEEDRFTVFRYRQFARHLPRQGIDILDAGCNTGRGGVVLKCLFPKCRITGLDCVPERISMLDSNIYNEKLCSFTDNIDLPSGSFDAIVAGEFIEHLPPGDVSPSLYEFFRILRLGGRLLLTTPNPHSLRNRMRNSSVLLDSAHLSQHSPKSLRRRLEDTGFTQIRIRGSGRASRILGEYFPYRALYGSYLAKAVKW
jgi:SAM-dependent methyltransferase